RRQALPSLERHPIRRCVSSSPPPQLRIGVRTKLTDQPNMAPGVLTVPAWMQPILRGIASSITSTVRGINARPSLRTWLASACSTRCATNRRNNFERLLRRRRVPTPRATARRARSAPSITHLWTKRGSKRSMQPRSPTSWPQARLHADDIVALETRIAEASWSRAESRDRDLTYNPMTPAELDAYAPGFPWSAWLATAEAVDTGRIVVRQLSAFPKFAMIF